MKFIECYIENFGRLHAFRYTFKDGVNSILADNGYGKTTLSVFIKCMLYGMEDTKKQGLDENDRKHYLPWQGGRCGGYLSLSVKGHRYRIERSFGAKASEDSFALYDLDTGKPSADFSSDLGTDVLGIDRDGFERTIFLSERNLWGKNENKSISAKLSDLSDCDGDIGGLDKALSLLEEKRKFYYKNGDKGEIGEIKKKISSCELEIADTERIREEALAAEKSLASQIEEKNALEEKMTALEGELDGLRTLKSKSALTEQYSAKLEAISREKARLNELKAVFGDTVPTAEDIDTARYKLRDAEELEKTAALSGENQEYAELSERFLGKTDLSEIEAIHASAKRLCEMEEKLSSLPKNEPPVSKYFAKRTPSRAELEAAVRKTKKSSAVPLIIAAAVLLCGLALLVLFLPLGIVCVALGAIILVSALVARKRRKTDISVFLSGLSDEPQPRGTELTAYLEFLLEALSDCELEISEAERTGEQIKRLSEEIYNTRKAVEEFLVRTGSSLSDDLEKAVSLTKESYLSFYKMQISAESASLSKQSALKRASLLKEESCAFISRFAVTGNEPFDELKKLLTEYNYLVLSLAKLEDECLELKSRYGIGDSSEVFNPEKLTSVETSLNECSLLLNAKRREITLAETKITDYAERIERGYELTARQGELKSALADAEHKLEIIRKTKSLLSEAKDLMTAKYLGKTRDSFEKYRSIIAGTDATREFSLDTSFSLSVTEGGTTHQHAAYSKGTRELYALATRLALSDALYDGDLPPLIFDDPFSSLDDQRVETAKKLLWELSKKRQIIYFTCHKSRELA